MTDTKIVKLYNVMDAQEKRGLQIWLENRNLWSQKKETTMTCCVYTIV